MQLHRAFPDARLLLIDPGFADTDAKTYAFWSDRTPPFEAELERTWSSVRLATAQEVVVRPLHRYRYHVLRGAVFRRAATRELAAGGRTELLAARVRSVRDDGEVRTERGTVRPLWTFDSRLRPDRVPADRHGHVALTQRFLGWDVRCDRDALDEATVTLMDFRTPQGRGDVRFLYVLPFDRRRALVEHVALHPNDEAEAIRAYLEDVLGVDRFTIERRESGSTPLTDVPFPRRTGRRILTLGIAGGRVKPSSGYAFTRIWEDGEAIVRSLATCGHPFALPAERQAYRFLDALLLRVLRHRPGAAPEIFLRMFARSPPDRVLALLDERAHLHEVLRLGLGLPAGPFLEAACREGAGWLRAAVARLTAPVPYDEE